VIFSSSIVLHERFFELARAGMIDRKNGEYVVPEKMIVPAGISFFGRPTEVNHLDVFVAGNSAMGKTALRQIEDFLSLHPDAFTVTVRYITTFRSFGVDSEGGPDEINEDIRQLLLQKDFPDLFKDYLKKTRTGMPYEKALAELGIDPEKLRQKEEEGLFLLEKDYELCAELGIKESPTFLWENRLLLTGMDSFRGFLKQLFPTASAKSTGQVSGKVDALVFYSPECDHCRWFLDDYIPQLETAFGGSVRFRLLDISIPENRTRQIQEQKNHGVFGDGVPEVFIGDREFTGQEEIEDKLGRYLSTITAEVE
jgi:hypothetical protein